MKIKTIAISKLKPADYNPRKISDEQLKKLKKSLAEFGDLSGIVFNRQTGNLVGGHQRLKCLPPDAKLEKTKLKKPSRTGTVAIGTITIDNEAYIYREVDWPPKKEKAANIAANKHGGEFDDDLLSALLKELSEIPDLETDLLGFDDSEITALLNSITKQEQITEQKYKSVFEVVVTCKNEAEQKKIYKFLKERGHTCRVLIL